ncbi:MAG: inositol monophosphatase family protein [Bacteroidota bacterium]
MKPSTKELEELEREIRNLVSHAGAFIKKEFETFSFNEVSYKGKNDPFSYVDVTAEEMVREGGATLLPGSGFINEEADNIPSQNGYEWIIDPLDGTVNFIHGMPHFCVSVALAYEKEVLVGHVLGVMAGEMFHAIKGNGAFLNHNPIHTSKQTQLPRSLLVTGFPYSQKDWLESYLNLVGYLIQECHGLRRLGAAALDLAYVAAGRVEGFFEFGLNPWDVAAGALIIQEAGGTVTDFQGESNFVFGSQILGTNGKIHQEVLDKMRSYLPGIIE